MAMDSTCSILPSRPPELQLSSMLLDPRLLYIKRFRVITDLQESESPAATKKPVFHSCRVNLSNSYGYLAFAERIVDATLCSLHKLKVKLAALC